MGLRILLGHEQGDDEPESMAVLFCSTSMTTLGPIFSPQGPLSAEEVAEAFLVWLARAQGIDDARTVPPHRLQELADNFNLAHQGLALQERHAKETH